MRFTVHLKFNGCILYDMPIMFSLCSLKIFFWLSARARLHLSDVCVCCNLNVIACDVLQERIKLTSQLPPPILKQLKPLETSLRGKVTIWYLTKTVYSCFL